MRVKYSAIAQLNNQVDYASRTRDTDNRNLAEMELYWRERFEAAKRKIEQLERDKTELVIENMMLAERLMNMAVSSERS